MFSVNVSFNTKKATTGLKKSLDQLVRSISLDLFKTIKRSTPIKDGRARRGWKMSGKGKNRFQITNSVPYIQRLDKGYSKQAPGGFSRQSIGEVINRYNTRRIK